MGMCCESRGEWCRAVLVSGGGGWKQENGVSVSAGKEGKQCTRGVTILVSEPGYETVGSKDLTCEDWMVNTRTDSDLSAAVQNALQTLLPQIHEEIREEFRTRSGSSNAGGNPPPITIHTWLERFNKQKPHSFEKATAPVDAENWISHMEKIFDVMGYEDAFKTRFAVYKFEGNALAWWKAYKQAKGGDAWLVTVTWADFKKDDDDTERPDKRHFKTLCFFNYALMIRQDYDITSSLRRGALQASLPYGSF
nr:zinc finger, CCHC-type, retrotransposon Gag domain protein [Tanacetum cinerariifolium]